MFFYKFLQSVFDKYLISIDSIMYIFCLFVLILFFIKETLAGWLALSVRIKVS